ncbi:MAG: hypothetical protein LUD84_08240 [Clostridiales bacterium]|nr:hypothetical protein [Clostridiales bacterium]
MKRQVALLLVLSLLVAVCSACGGSQTTVDGSASAAGSVSTVGESGGEEADTAEVEAALEQFLTNLYTTDDQGRYTAYLAEMEALDSAAGSSSEDSQALLDAAADNYYADFATLLTEDVYAQLVQNRIPFKYDELYADTPATVQDVALTAQEDCYSYTVTLQIGNEAETRSGELQWETQDGTVLVSYFYEAD